MQGTQSMENPSYYSILTADVRYDSELKANEKLLYSEITALADRYGYCWASNQYFADLYSVSARSIRDWISHLNKKGYIQVQIDNSDINNSRRKIFLGLGRNLPRGEEEIFLGGEEENFHQIIQDKNNTRLTDIKGDVGKAINEFKQMRKSIKKPLTDNALNRLIKRLNDMTDSDEEKIAILNQSIDHCWQDIYPLKKPLIKQSTPVEEEPKEDINDVIAKIERQRNNRNSKGHT